MRFPLVSRVTTAQVKLKAIFHCFRYVDKRTFPTSANAHHLNMADDGGDDGAQYAAPIQGKHYKIRKHGHEEWTDEKYEARYRIDKAGTRYLSNWFAATVFCSTLAIRSRTSLDAFERVSTHFNVRFTCYAPNTY